MSNPRRVGKLYGITQPDDFDAFLFFILVVAILIILGVVIGALL